MSATASAPVPTLAQLRALSNDQLGEWLVKAAHVYYREEEPIMTDALFDAMKDMLTKRDPKHPALKKISHATVDHTDAAPNKAKVQLPYTMWSLDKVKPVPAVLARFVKKYPGDCVASDKLDGISALYYIKAGKPPALYTRGDGIIGQDISHMLAHMRNVPALGAGAGAASHMAVRCELLLTKKNWETISNLGSNPRNVVAGTINAKTPNLQIARLIDMVAYEFIAPAGLVPSEQMARLADLGFTTVHNQLLGAADMTVDALSARLLERKAASPYEIDGVVVVHNAVHRRKGDGNPDYAFAFKSLVTQQRAEVTISEVEWNISKDRFAKPLAKFAKVALNGVEIKQATLFNAAFVEANKVGPGSRVIIIRAGDVIPHILEVLSPSSSGAPAMPAFAYTWNETHVDILVDGDGDDAAVRDQVALKELINFFDKVDVAGVSEGLITKLYGAGYKTVRAVADVTVADLLKLDGVKDKMAAKVAGAVHDAMAALTPMKVLVASNAFGRGFGERRFKLIMDHVPAAFVRGAQPAVADLTAIDGIEVKTATAFLEGLPRFWKFVDDNGLGGVFAAAAAAQPAPASPASAPVLAAAPPQTFADKAVVFTGFRDTDLEAAIVARGGRVATSVSGKTSFLVIKDASQKKSGKVEKAEALGVSVITRDELQNMLHA